MSFHSFWDLFSKNYGRLIINSTVFFTIAISSAVILNPKRLKILKKIIFRQIINKSKRKKNANVDIGAIFGMDVGGTLTKIVYFQQRKAEEIPPRLTAGSLPAQVQQPSTATAPDAPSLPKRNSSDSLAQLDLPDHQAALQELYTYMDSTANKSVDNGVIRDDALSVYSPFLEGRLHFLHFETRNMVEAINYVSASAFTQHILSIGCTGGGAHKYANEIFEKLEITVNKYDELGCLVRGMLFALTNFKDECYTYRSANETINANVGNTEEEKEIEKKTATIPANASKAEEDEKTIANSTIDVENEDKDKRKSSASAAANKWQKDVKEYTEKIIVPIYPRSIFPYLVVNIGSGVSILKVSGPGKFQRVSGTSLGGGTYWGLCRLLTKCQSYEEVLDLAEHGNAGSVDMLVRDIYGGDYAGLLSGSMVASSFGKLVMKENPLEGVTDGDLALALLMMITNNIGQVAYLNAQLHSCNKIFFVGSFLRHNSISCRRLSFAIEFWSSGRMEALFLSHEGYFGALGTFLQSAFGDDEIDKILLNEYENSNSFTPFSEKNSAEKDNKTTTEVGNVGVGKEVERSTLDSKKIVKSLDSYDLTKTLSTENASGPLPVKLPQAKRCRSASDDISHRPAFGSSSFNFGRNSVNSSVSNGNSNHNNPVLNKVRTGTDSSVSSNK